MDSALSPPKILIAEDEPSLRTILKKIFLKKNYHVETVFDGEMAIKKIGEDFFNVALVDINMPGKSGFEVLSAARKERPDLALILITAQDTMKNAVEAMKQGAFDYLAKPFEMDELEMMVERALETQRLHLEVKQLKSQIGSQTFDTQAKIIGQSKSIREIYKLIGKLAANDVSVLVTGESGTGKELIAKSIHHSSARNHFPFIAVNCAAVPKDLLESELFGHRKGSFTGADESRIGYFEAAHKGTLFLDEIGDMPLSLQSKLLRVLQEKEVMAIGAREAKLVDVRIISATNQNLEKLVKEKKFREDLFFRLNIVPIEVPSLRNRKEDIEILCTHFLQKFQNELSIPPKSLSTDALDLLKNYSWPGNVRELENIIKRAMVLVNGPIIKTKDLKSLIREKTEDFSILQTNVFPLEKILEREIGALLDGADLKKNLNLYEKTLPLIEKPLLTLILKKTKGNQIQAAEILGINRNTLRKKIRELNIKMDRFSDRVE